MNLLDRHIFKSVLFACCGAVGLFVFVVALPNVIKDLVGPLLAGQLSADTFLRLVMLIFAYVICYALPMGILTGVLLTLGRLSADSEITAMRATGVSMGRIARPVFLLGALCGAAALYINFETMPRARVRYEKELIEAVRNKPLSMVVPNTFIRDFKGVVIYVGEKLGESILRDIWIWELDDQGRVTRLIRAESGRLDYDLSTDSLVPHLQNARSEERPAENPEDFSKSPYAPAVQKAGADFLRLPVGRYLFRDRLNVKKEWLTYAELRAEAASLAALPPPTSAEADDRARQKMATSIVLHDKFNFSLAVFSFAFLGVPLGIKASRRETSANLGLALVLVLSYYSITIMVKWLDRQPEFRPDLLLWAPNLLFIALGVWLLRRIER